MSDETSCKGVFKFLDGTPLSWDKYSRKNWKRLLQKGFFHQILAKTLERSTDKEKTKKTTTAPANQTLNFTSKFETWFQLGFC